MLNRKPFGAPSICAAFALVAMAVSCQCGDEDIRRTLPPGARVDVFRQADRPVIDVLWVIDNSPTMSDVQDNLAGNLISFFRYLDEGDVDYQIGVTTTDVRRHGGQLVGSPRILTPDTPDVMRAFRGNVHVGTDGSAKEEGLAAAELLFQGGSFLRPDVTCGESEECVDWQCVARDETVPPAKRSCHASYVFIVWVSDQDDRSFGEIDYYWRVFSQVQGIGNENKIILAAIVGPDEEIEPGSPFRGCVTEHGSAEAGGRYIELVEMTGGVWGSICDESFEGTLQEMGATAVGLERKFQLSEVPDLDTLEVNVYYPCEARAEEFGLCDYTEDQCDAADPRDRGVLCIPPQGGPNGWIYEEESGSLFFQGASVPGLRARIEVIYMAESDPLEW